jgi:hypothetical protein
VLTMQVYEELQGHSNDMFYSSSGMLLAKTLHHAYDALKWSLYQKVSTSTFCMPFGAESNALDRATRIMCTSSLRKISPTNNSTERLFLHLDSGTTKGLIQSLLLGTTVRPSEHASEDFLWA